MTIEIAFLISLVSIGFTVYNSLSGRSRRVRTDAREETAQTTALMVKLETINNSLIELKSEFRSAKEDVQEVRERLIIVEQKAAAAHERIDSLTRVRES